MAASTHRTAKPDRQKIRVKMKALVIGAGKMGMPIAYAFNKLGFHVTQVDLFQDLLQTAAAKYKSLGMASAIDLCLQSEIFIQASPDFDICLSAAPFHVNPTWAQWCKDRRIPYCDLGGNAAVSQSIHSIFETEGSVFTDLGLAPGFVNILGEQAYREQHDKGAIVKKIKLRCGGLPVFPHQFPPLYYSSVFSVKGLRNEYSGKCQVIRRGRIVEEDALGGLETVSALSGNYEAFATSGGLSTSLESMHSRKIQELDYKTIRFPGHCNQIKLMLESMDEESFIKTIGQLCPPTEEDWVLIQVITVSNEIINKKEIEIKHDSTWTAMQQATAFPAVAVAAILSDRRWIKPIIKYSDVPFDEFQKNLQKIGFVYNEHVTEDMSFTQKVRHFVKRSFG